MPRREQFKRLAARVFKQAIEDDVAGLSAELAYRSFLELFPFFIFLSMVGGVAEASFHIYNPARQALELLSQSLPQGAADPIRQQLENVLGSQQGLVGLPIVGVLWLAAGSGASLLKAMNRIYEIEETRPFWERYLVGLWLTLLAGTVVALVILIMSLGQVVGQLQGGDNAPGWFQVATRVARWPLLVLVLLAEASVVYRVAPNTKPPWGLITPGALVFVAGWLLASTLFVVYVDKSGGYAGTYGVLGGVVVLLLWLQISAYALLLGAELNDALEHPSTRSASDNERSFMRDPRHRPQRAA